LGSGYQSSDERQSRTSTFPFKGDYRLGSRKFICITLLSVVFVSSLLLFYQPLLKEAGEFLAPCSSEKAEAVILEGSQTVRNGAINVGLKLLFDGKAERMVLVIHQPLKDDQLVALQEKYIRLLINESDRIGLGKGKFQITVVPFAGHPATLNEARFVLTKLTQDGIRSAILLSKGFHTRRSFGVYNQEGARVGVRIIPSPYFTEYKNDNWWKHLQGVRDFFEQTIKLAYYLLRGYVSIKSLSHPG
jgi:hypothetical protein